MVFTLDLVEVSAFLVGMYVTSTPEEMEMLSRVSSSSCNQGRSALVSS